MAKKRQIFRQVALEKLASPEQLDQLLKVTNPAGWVALLALGLLLAAALLWGIFGSLPTKIPAQGILIAPGGVNDVVTPVLGQISDIYFEVGDEIQAGQVVARIAEKGQLLNTKIESPYAGHIIEIKVNEGAVVERGTPLLSVESTQEELDLEAVVYAAPTDGKKITPGMAVQISPSTVRQEEFGLMQGRVVSVGKFPATRQGMLRTLANPELADKLSATAAPIEIKIDLATKKSGETYTYQWTSAKDTFPEVNSGTLCETWIITERQCPLNLVLPQLGNYVCPNN